MEILRGRGDIKHKIIRGKCEAVNLSYYNELVLGHIYLDVYNNIFFTKRNLGENCVCLYYYYCFYYFSQ